MKDGMEIVKPQQNAMISAAESSDQARSIAETQSAMVIAKRFPRNIVEARDRILTACGRQRLAEVSTYEYSRGGSAITGPSIRLAEAIAQNWGNMQFGIRELDQRDGASTVEAFAWDVETNTRQVKTFQVRHMRHTKKGSYRLEDPRDIYEMVANQGARRLRACILGVIPGDVVDEALEQCEATLRSKAEVTPERIGALTTKFGEFGVSRTMLERKMQRRLDTISPAQMIGLGRIYNSLKDGMSVIQDWFEPDEAKDGGTPEPEAAGNEGLKSKLKKQKPAPKEKKKDPDPPPETDQDPDPEKDEGTEEYVPCPNGDLMQRSYCESTCPDRKGCPSFD